MLKILCLHGYRQTGETFREKLGSFRKIVKKHAELTFISAPLRVPPAEEEAHDQNGWWFSGADDSFHAQEETDCCKGFQESLTVIEKAFHEHGPFDGVLGFSQGAALAAILCFLLDRGDLSYSFNFAILIAGFRSHSSQHDIYYTKQAALPTLHVLGENDKVIQKEMSEELLQYFCDPKTYQHPGGHFVPASGSHKKIYVEFLDKMLQLKNESSDNSQV